MEFDEPTDVRGLRTLLIQMIRNGIIDDETLLTASHECEAMGDAGGAHELNCLLLEAHATPQVDIALARRKAERR